MKRRQWIKKLWRVCSVRSERKALRNKSLLLGVTGGVAAYKSVDLVRRLREEGLVVTVIMTKAAQYFVTPLSLQIASQKKVYSDLFHDPMAHIYLPAEADVMVIAPATADIIGKCARGIADDLLSTSFLSFRGQVIIAPAMNWRMYENPIFQENMKYLLSKGIIQVGPERGSLACGEEGMGRMADTSDIVDAVLSSITEKDLRGEKILVTAGPTREYLDPVRFLSNRSSGRMGYAIARAALRRGADVTLISGHSFLEKPRGMRFISVESASDMLTAIEKKVRASTVLIMSAAVSDFMPAEKHTDKIEKAGDLIVRFSPSPDIISAISGKRRRPFIIGFAAETGKRIARARKKLKEKKMDMIVFNDVTEEGSGFDTDTNRVVIIDREKETALPRMSKDSVADAILDKLVEVKT
jgi:phosphopantothenoylcysteine decarboxylase/phosphopantothenate--cysteine ligase